MKISDVNIIVRKIDPIPSNGYPKFTAKVQFLYIEDSTGRRKVEYQFGETWGKTESEAEEKMRENIKDWISSQSSS